MSTEQTIQMLELYRQQVGTPRFLSGFFQSPARNFHNSQDVEIDILREDEEVAVTVADISAGARLNEATILTNKRFTPPVYKEAGPVNAYQLMLRSAGQDPFQDPAYQANAMRASMDIGRRCEEKIRRAVELMASQVLQTGELTIIDDGGNTSFAMDFFPKATHFPQTAVSWATSATAVPIDDLESLANVIMTNGREMPTDLIMGRTAYLNFMATTQVLNYADNRRINIVQLDRPTLPGSGAVYHGTLSAGQYRFNLWTYMGRYKAVDSGTITEYITPTNVVMLNPSSRRDLTWGNIPTIGGRDPRALPFMPSRVASSAGGIDLHYNAWVEKDNTALTVQVGARPLTIPTAIDTFGCLNTVQP